MSGGFAVGAEHRLPFRAAIFGNTTDFGGVNSKVDGNKLADVVRRTAPFVAGTANWLHGKRVHVIPVFVLDCRRPTIDALEAARGNKPAALDLCANASNYICTRRCDQFGALA